MRERARTLALIVCLILLATLLAGLSAGLAPRGSNIATQEVPSLGTILVRAAAEQEINGYTVAVPIAGANISIIRSATFVIPLVFQTNSSGEFEISLGTGPYVVTVSDSQFRNATSVLVHQNATTEVDATVTRHSYPSLFSDLTDTDSSGASAPWTYVYVAVNSSLNLPMNGSLFMDGTYGSPVVTLVSGEGANQTLEFGQPLTGVATTLGGQSEVPVRVVSYSLDASPISNIIWLTLQPESFFSVSGLVSLALATYNTELQVTIHAT